MSASSSPVRRPPALRASARFTAVVDLPTPPLPEATAMMAPTPGSSGRCGAASPPARGLAVGVGGGGARSAVSTADTEATPGSAFTAASQAWRKGSSAAASRGSTSSAKPTLAPLITTPVTMPRLTTSS